MNDKDQIEKFKKWLVCRGVEIMPTTNEYESLRFKGREVGVLYKSGKTNNAFTAMAITCFIRNKKWDGAPINIGRKQSYKSEKAKLLNRDGSDCFYCDLPMNDDITLEHLIALSSGGKNALSNMVLCHEACNLKMNNLPISEKVRFAITNRIKNQTTK